MRAAVVGAGLCGLTTAHRLTQAGWDVTVFEATDAIGGRVQTLRTRGYQIDLGASAFSLAYEPYIALVDELGIERRPVSPYVAIPRDGRLHELSMARMLTSGARTRLLSPRAKLRAARLGLDVARAKRAGQLDYADMRKAARLDTETARAYALRRLSPELDQYLCEPIVRTMLMADSDAISKVELFSGVANIFATSIATIVGGQGRVCETLAANLDVRLGCAVESVTAVGDGVGVDGERYDAAVVTAPQPVLEYTQCLKVAIGTRTQPRTPAFLVQIPSCEDAEIALLFLDHNKCADRAPAGHGLIDACWEAGASARWMDASDDAIVARTLETVLRYFPGLDVDFTHVTRWHQALPRTVPGAYRRIGEFNAALDPAAPIQFAGDYMSAAGQNTAVALGNRAAANIARANDRSQIRV